MIGGVILGLRVDRESEDQIKGWVQQRAVDTNLLRVQNVSDSFELKVVAEGLSSKAKAAGSNSGDLRPIWLPTVDTLRNFLLTPTMEMIGFFQILRAP
jgi:hypothetical protein